jgi:Holliday junction DNA helicase RuvA
MIGWLAGKLLAYDKDRVIVDVGGVGYQVAPSAGVLRHKVKIGADIRLFIYTHVREDQLALYGFSSLEEKQMFELLLSVSGVGPKSALAVLSRGNPEEVRSAVAEADVEFFTAVPGLGKKTSQRIIIDLKSKLGDLAELDLKGEKEPAAKELIAALKSMGFGPEEAREAVKRVDLALPLEKQIRLALKKIGGEKT